MISSSPSFALFLSFFIVFHSLDLAWIIASYCVYIYLFLSICWFPQSRRWTESLFYIWLSIHWKSCLCSISEERRNKTISISCYHFESNDFHSRTVILSLLLLLFPSHSLFHLILTQTHTNTHKPVMNKSPHKSYLHLYEK